MELFPSFLLLVLTWTAQKGFCKPMNSEEQMNMTDTTENRIPSGMSNMTDGDEEKMFFGAQPKKATDGGEKAFSRGENSTNGGENSTNVGEKAINGGENSTNGGENSTNGGEKATNRGEEVKMMFRKRRMHTTGHDGKGEGGRIGLTKIDDMWLTDDQLPLDMRKKTGRHGVQNLFRSSPGRVKEKYRWPKRTLYYRLAPRTFTREQIEEIQNAIKNLKKSIGKNCVKFRYDRDRDDAVVIGQGEGCQSKVGYLGWAPPHWGWRQNMSLDNGCFSTGTIQHEFMHSLGVSHTQNRWDRDKYVYIYERNIQEGKEKNFKLKEKSVYDTFGLPYDYNSVMHYGKNSFAKNERWATIYTLNSKGRIDWTKMNVIGQRDGLSEGDVNLIKKMYKCK